ncbi:unnamed protein product [Closterium sp. Yama58-4]|nr:unnamed protein product [Closterium sp. Yama58-4]
MSGRRSGLSGLSSSDKSGRGGDDSTASKRGDDDDRDRDRDVDSDSRSRGSSASAGRSGGRGGSGEKERDSSGGGGGKGGGAMVLFQNVGGSVTFLLQIALLAWGIRQLRSVLAKRRESRQRNQGSSAGASPAFASLSPLAALMMAGWTGESGGASGGAGAGGAGSSSAGAGVPAPSLAAAGSGVGGGAGEIGAGRIGAGGEDGGVAEAGGLTPTARAAAVGGAESGAASGGEGGSGGGWGGRNAVVVPHVVIDVRARDVAKSQPIPLPSPHVLNIPVVSKPSTPSPPSPLFPPPPSPFPPPESDLLQALQLPAAAWEHRFHDTRQPDRRHLLLFLSSHGNSAQRAATVAASLGYTRSCVLAGGLDALKKFLASSAAAGTPAPSPSEADGEGHGADGLGGAEGGGRAGGESNARGEEERGGVEGRGGEGRERDGGGAEAEGHGRGEAAQGGEGVGRVVWEEVGGGKPWFYLIDVRRFDERVLYGGIPGSVHIPAEVWPVALSLGEEAWKQRYQWPKMEPHSLLILHSNTGPRAYWAAQVARDAGYNRCFVMREGTHGWRLHPSVCVYDDYPEVEQGGVPPAPQSFTVEAVDEGMAEQQLRLLGIAL